MAFTTELIVNGRTYSAAYIKATAVSCNINTTTIHLEVWETQSLRQDGVPSLIWPQSLRVLDTSMTLQADNPIEYAYNLLEASAEFPNATWNV